MPYVAITICLILMFYLVLIMLTGRARVKGRVKAPATSGDANFERHFRVQQNTMEQLVMVLPAIWLFAQYVDAQTAMILGLLFLVGRIQYAIAYVKEPKTRGSGFLIGALATVGLVIGALIGSISSLL